MIAKASREETNGSEGIEVLVNERFKTETGEGIYTHKVIHLSKYVLRPTGSVGEFQSFCADSLFRRLDACPLGLAKF